MEKEVEVRRYVVGPLATNCYLVWSPLTRQAIVIDPGGGAEEVLGDLEREGLTLIQVVNTHGHADHIAGNAALCAATGAPLAVGADDAGMLASAEANLSLWLGDPFVSPPPGRLLRHGDVLDGGGMRWTIRSTPGHTPGGLTLVGYGMAFTGDTLFAGGIGRTDLPGGDERVLLAAIAGEILTLPDATAVHPGHGEATTVGREKAGNPFLPR